MWSNGISETSGLGLRRSRRKPTKFDVKALRPANLQKHWQQLRTLEQALNQAAIIAITDQRGTITFANDAFLREIGTF
ncbi:hypothetical protein GCM10010965_21660 [Caldalkalibacillus thermarum]|nr:hypothetical protein GCM10010965_21660 [Caldalkalibacillus thermarum]